MQVRMALERVVLTTGGNVVACWQVVTGSDPVSLRGYAHALCMGHMQCDHHARALHLPGARHCLPVSLQGYCTRVVPGLLAM